MVPPSLRLPQLVTLDCGLFVPDARELHPHKTDRRWTQRLLPARSGVSDSSQPRCASPMGHHHSPRRPTSEESTRFLARAGTLLQAPELGPAARRGRRRSETRETDETARAARDAAVRFQHLGRASLGPHQADHQTLPYAALPGRRTGSAAPRRASPAPSGTRPPPRCPPPPPNPAKQAGRREKRFPPRAGRGGATAGGRDWGREIPWGRGRRGGRKGGSRRRGVAAPGVAAVASSSSSAEAAQPGLGGAAYSSEFDVLRVSRGAQEGAELW